jgi:hypothetical protein
VTREGDAGGALGRALADASALSRDDVVESAPTALWAVETGAWANGWAPLSDDVIALVATPLVVCAESR